MEQQHIVHVTHVGGYPQFLFRMMVRIRQVIVGEVLARQVPDGKPLSGFRFVAVDKLPEYSQKNRILVHPAKQPEQPFVAFGVDGREQQLPDPFGRGARQSLFAVAVERFVVKV